MFSIDGSHFGSVVLGVVVAWLVARFLNRTVGTEYVKRADFKKFLETHDARCKNCQSRASVSQIKKLLIELTIKAGVPAHEVAKIADIGSGDNNEF